MTTSSSKDTLQSCPKTEEGGTLSDTPVRSAFEVFMPNTSNEADPAAVSDTGQDVIDTRPTKADLMPPTRMGIYSRDCQPYPTLSKEILDLCPGNPHQSPILTLASTPQTQAQTPSRKAQPRRRSQPMFRLHLSCLDIEIKDHRNQGKLSPCPNLNLLISPIRQQTLNHAIRQIPIPHIRIRLRLFSPAP